MKYTIEEIENIKKTIKNFSINENTNNKINNLVLSLKQMKKTNTPKREYENWNNIRGFKITQFKKSEDLDIIKNKIKIEINKITNKNFEVIQRNIIELMENVNNLEYNEKETIYLFIYDILSKNSFNFKINCNLLKNLLNIEQFKELIFVKIKTYQIIFNEELFSCQISNTNENYDMLCKYNESKDKRINYTNFFAHMFLFDIYLHETLFENIFYIQNKMTLYKNDINNKNQNIELSHHIFTFLNKNVINKIKIYELFNKVIENLENIKNANVKDNVGLCNKIKFQHMDILDLIKN
tara:strand:- start:543 stop:1430 length:888 start_codon:yes stop_codon:yes gene_type:complete